MRILNTADPPPSVAEARTKGIEGASRPPGVHRAQGVLVVAEVRDSGLLQFHGMPPKRRQTWPYALSLLGNGTTQSRRDRSRASWAR